MKNRILISALFVFFVLLSANGFTQYGSVRVFSEISNSKVYLDDLYKGTDISLIDSVVPGSHYLKVTNNDVIIYGELIEVRSNEITTILVKDSKEIQEKLLESKYAEIQKYKEQKLDVMLNTTYVTETKTGSETKGGAVNVFPGYYALSAKTESTTISKTFAVTDWFIVQGTKKITHLQLAKLVGDEAVVNSYEEKKAEAEEKNLSRAKRSRATMGILGAIMAPGGALMLKGGLNATGETAKVFGIVFGSTFAIMGTTMVIMAIVSDTESFNQHWYTPSQNSLVSFDYAVKKTQEYNQKLKAELGLPPTFEPAE